MKRWNTALIGQTVNCQDGQILDLDSSSTISAYLTRFKEKAVNQGTNQPLLSGESKSTTTLCIKTSWPARVLINSMPRQSSKRSRKPLLIEIVKMPIILCGQEKKNTKCASIRKYSFST